MRLILAAQKHGADFSIVAEILRVRSVLERSLIIERYVTREILQSFAAVLAVLLLVFIANRFVRLLTEAAAGRLPGDVIAQLVIIKLTASLTVLLPMAFFFGVLLALGRLYKDSEVVAMSAGGIGLQRLSRAVATPALAFGCWFGVVLLRLAPHLRDRRLHRHPRARRGGSDRTEPR